MTADGGMLAFVESSREHYQLMASMLFMLSGRDARSRPGSADFRATENRICLTRAEWHEQLRRAAFTPTVTVPDGNGTRRRSSSSISTSPRPPGRDDTGLRKLT